MIIKAVEMGFPSAQLLRAPLGLMYLDAASHEDADLAFCPRATYSFSLDASLIASTVPALGRPKDLELKVISSSIMSLI